MRRELLAGIAAGAAGTTALNAVTYADPRNWPASSWISDLVPHLAYGLTTAAVFDEIYRHRP